MINCIIIKAERAIASEALVAQNGWLMWLVSNDLAHGWTHVGETFRSCWRAVWRVKSAKKNKKKIWWNFFLKIFFACYLTLPHLCTRDDSLGFEDCRLATHLLNWVCKSASGRLRVRQVIVPGNNSMFTFGSLRSRDRSVPPFLWRWLTLKSL